MIVVSFFSLFGNAMGAGHAEMVRVGTYLANHENLVRLGKLGKLLQRGHEPLVVVSPPGGVDEDHVVALARGVGDGVLGHGRGVLAVALLVNVHLAAALSGRELLEVPHVHGELLHRAGAERVARGDEHAVLVLQEEVADLGEVGRLADAVDADDGDDVRAAGAEGRGGWGGDGVDFAEEVERRLGREHLGQGGFHRGLDTGADALETGRLDAHQFLLDTLAQPDRGLAGDILLQEVLLHALHGFVEIRLGERLAANHVAEQAAHGAEAGAQETAALGARPGVGLFGLGGGEDIVDLVAQILEDELPFGGGTPCG